MTLSENVKRLVRNHDLCAVLKVYLHLREWLSGGVSPCQGEGRGFESRLALKNWIVPVFSFLKIYMKRYRQMVRHWILIPAFPGSNPGSAAKKTHYVSFFLT